MNHQPPKGIDTSAAFYFITVCAADRKREPFIPCATEILESARYRHNAGLWFLSLFLIMPDHIHMLVHIPDGKTLEHVIGDWKHYLAAKFDLDFQKNFFDTRIRDAPHYAEKWDYIIRNPVTRRLVATPREWPYVIAFSRETGKELPHR